MKTQRYSIPKIIKDRRTVRNFVERNISKGIIRTLLEAARNAPCPNNVQPWYFFIAKKNSRTTSKVIKCLRIASKRKSIAVSVFLQDAIKTLTTANLVIYVFNKNILKNKYRVLGPYYQRKGHLFEVQAIAAAVENIIITAEKFNLGTVWLGSPIFVSKSIERIFCTSFELNAVIGIGYYNKKPKKPIKIAINEMSQFTK